MLIKKAGKKDIDALEKMYYDVTAHLESNINYPAWINGLYPTRETFEEAVSKGGMYAAYDDDGAIIGGMVLKEEDEPEFCGIKWQTEAAASETYALCTLAAARGSMGKGVGEALARFAVDLARENGKKAVRLDVTAINTPAIKLYEKLGFKYIAEMDEGEEYAAQYGERIFYLYEKVI